MSFGRQKKGCTATTTLLLSCPTAIVKYLLQDLLKQRMVHHLQREKKIYYIWALDKLFFPWCFFEKRRFCCPQLMHLCSHFCHRWLFSSFQCHCLCCLPFIFAKCTPCYSFSPGTLEHLKTLKRGVCLWLMLLAHLKMMVYCVQVLIGQLMRNSYTSTYSFTKKKYILSTLTTNYKLETSDTIIWSK